MFRIIFFGIIILGGLTYSSIGILPFNTDPKTAGLFPLYGNWCGPLHPKSHVSPPAVDSIDVFCNKHDMCFREAGYGNFDCTKSFLFELLPFLVAHPFVAVVFLITIVLATLFIRMLFAPLFWFKKT